MNGKSSKTMNTKTVNDQQPPLGNSKEVTSLGEEGGNSSTGPSVSFETLEAAFPPSQRPPFPEDSKLQFGIRQRLTLRQLSAITEGESSALECMERELSGTNPEAFVADPLNPSTLMATLLNTHGEVTCTDITSDGSRVAGGFRNCGIRVWTCNHRKVPDSKLGEEQSDKRPLRLIGHTHPVYSVSWAPGGRFLLSGGGSGTVRLWDVHQKRAQNVVVYRSAFHHLHHYLIGACFFSIQFICFIFT